MRFPHLETSEGTGRVLAAYGASFTDAPHTCALVGGIGLLVAAVVALALIGVRARPGYGASGAATVKHSTGAAAGDVS
ncbi:hypothetical protein [Streptomyces violaceusniger]|uniref:Uncharacterized protein n=1 Tax=Streptomyces violaceusniger (strain Tu 4113) TaxID=653045 RepID=G2PGL6_STRV4|nr:hypothetical protein [Streptomyces violaceusniger]AEM85595.1 hypothetical protein Strvi_6104 [Streptomyces violaceusniger Tu 4113]